MNKAFLILGMYCSSSLFAQPSLQNTVQAGISLPVNSNGAAANYAMQAVHFGNHLDYVFGAEGFQMGLGAYLGQLSSLGTNSDYIKEGQALAEKYRMPLSQVNFNESSFKSTHLMLGPVLSYKSVNWKFSFWGKGGYGFNEPGRYAVVYREGTIVNNLLVSQAGENKNSLAYNVGAGIRYDISEQLGFVIGANYFNTKTDQVLYNFEREKGTAAAYESAPNRFIQASVGLQFSPFGTEKNRKGLRQERTSDAQGLPGSVGNDDTGTNGNAKAKTKKPRTYQPGQPNYANRVEKEDNGKNDSLYFSPEKIELRTAKGGGGRVPVKTVNEFMTAFVYKTAEGPMIGQCSGAALPGDPVPGIDVRLKSATTNQTQQVRTNADGSFSANNMTPGNYDAQVEGATIPLVIRGADGNGRYSILEEPVGTCSQAKNMLALGGKIYVEVMENEIVQRDAASGQATGKRTHRPIVYKSLAEEHSVKSPRDAASGLATGRRMHKPYRVVDTDVEVNWENVYTADGKLYAEATAFNHEVKSPRDAASGLATGKRMMVTGDVDGDGIPESVQKDQASGLATGRRQHMPIRISMVEPGDCDGNEDVVVAFKNTDGSCAGLLSRNILKSYFQSGARAGADQITLVNVPNSSLIKEFVTDDDGDGVPETAYQLKGRDAGSGLATGKRQHKPYFLVIDEESDGSYSYEVLSPRDAASGQATGKRMSISTGRDVRSGMPTGKRMHKPVRMHIGSEVYTVVIPEDDGPTLRGQNNNTVRSNRGGYMIAILTGNDEEDVTVSAASASVHENPLYNPPVAEQSNVLARQGKGGNAGSGSSAPAAFKSNPYYVSNELAGESLPYASIVTVAGSNGKDHLLMSPKNIVINSAVEALSPYQVYTVAAAGAGDAAKATVNTSRSNIKSVERISCANGSCVIECIVEIAGEEYEAVVTGAFRKGHDVALNAIRNMK